VIESVFLDVDGVLTDGTVSVDALGNEIKRISFDDIDAIFELKKVGIRIGFLTGEDTAFCRYVRERFKPDFFLSGCKDKLAAFKDLVREFGLDEAKACYVGDSKKDITLLQHVNFSYVPANVNQLVKRAARKVLRASRGEGVIREVAEEVLQFNAEVDHSGNEKLYWVQRIDEHLEVVKAIKQDLLLLSQLAKVGSVLVSAFQAGCKLLICGNGRSESDSQYLAAELMSRFSLERALFKAEALTASVAFMTELRNYDPHESILAKQVEVKGQPGDVLMGICSSGDPRDVVQAMEGAKARGMTTVGLAGSKQGREIARASDYCLQVPSIAIGTRAIQEAHLLISHVLCEYVEERLFGQ